MKTWCVFLYFFHPSKQPSDPLWGLLHECHIQLSVHFPALSSVTSYRNNFEKDRAIDPNISSSKFVVRSKWVVGTTTRGVKFTCDG